MARVLVTRASPEAEISAARLRERGHSPIVAPLRVVQPAHVNLPAQPDALIATSAKAFLGEGLPESWRDLPIHCVGKQTAEAAVDAGFSQVLAGAGDANALASQIAARATPGATFLWLVGEPHTTALSAKLDALGFRTSVLIRYRMIRVPALPETARRALAEAGCDAVLHFSAESARAFFDLADSAGLLARTRSLQHICLSQAVADAVTAAAGFNLHVAIAEAPDSESLLEALDAAFPPAT